MKRTRTLRTFSLFQNMVALTLSGVLPLATIPEAARALPHGGVVSKGSATLAYSTGKLGIKQTTSSATFDWGSYNVKAGQSVVYSVPGSTSVSMNYIGGTTPSSINGTVTSNGILEFMNPNGLIFGSGSVVSAAGVMAFGSATPWGKPTGTVTNAGTLTATDNGTVALVGTAVTNSGTITAPGGEVLLASGSTVTPIATTGVSSLSVATTGGGLVDDSGIVSAETVGGKTGTVILQAGMQTGGVALDASAVVDASAPNGGNGGQVFINASGVVLDNTAPINVSSPYGIKGTVKIDPDYILSGTTLDICNAAGLEYLDGNQSSYLSDTIVLESNMNLANGSTLYNWTPLGNGSSSNSYFTGTFKGNGYVVSGYTITTTANDAGFIGYLYGGVVENLGVAGTVNGGSYQYIGGVVGYNNLGTVAYSYNTGSVSGGSSVGGVVGYNTGTVEYSYNTGSVSGGSAYVGGVVGYNSCTVSDNYYNTTAYSGSAIGGGTTSGPGISNNNGISASDFAVTNSTTVGVSNLGTFNTWSSGTFQSSPTNAPWFEGSVVSGSGTITAPMLVDDLPTATVTENNGTSVYNGSTVTAGYTTTYTMGGTTLSPNVTVTTSVGPNAATTTNTPTYSISAPTTQTSVYSVSAVSGKWTITPAPLTVTGTTATGRVYNGTDTVVLSGATLSGSLYGNSITLANDTSGTLSNSGNAGTDSVTTAMTLSGTGTGNFFLTQPAVSSVTITKADLTATAATASMTYGGTVPTLSGTVTGFVNGQTLASDGGSATWTTSATSATTVGQYGIVGNVTLGSSYSGDYTVLQAPGNATALTITPASSTSGSSGSSGTGDQGIITSTNFPPVLQTVDLFQKLPSLPGSSSPETFSNSGSFPPSSSGTSTMLGVTPDSSLKVLQPLGDDTSGDGILSVQELKQ